MNHDKTQIKSTQEINPRVYAWSTPDMPRRQGWLKIGYTERESKQRIKESTGQTGLKFNIEWEKRAKFHESQEYFKDHDFHQFLRQHKIPREKGTEWFNFNPDGVEKSKRLINQFILEDFDATPTTKKSMYRLRVEQQEAVTRTLNYFKDNPQSEFLWNAKPRFGKTLTTYALALEMKADKVLVVTNRPAIANSWFDDFEKFISWQSRFAFVSETSSLFNRPTLSRKQYNAENRKMQLATNEDKPLIEFLSLQDLKGSKYFGRIDGYDKLKHISDIEWDLLVIDEAHEGVDTLKTDVAFDQITRKHTLHLSGTPFKALADGKFTKDAIFNWSYADEQEAKQNWNDDSHNPYENLPTLSLFTYQLSPMITDRINQGADTDEEGGMDYAFDLNEFFKTKDNGSFEYEADIIKFLDSLTTHNKYPFSTDELRSEIKHSLWLLNRVASAEALAKLLNNHPTFKEYKVVLAVGSGKNFDEEATDSEKINSSYEAVKKAIAENEKTITLSVGQLTTGVTIPEWTAVMMLSNLNSPSLYMQAAFRAQNPWEYTDNSGNRLRKENAYIFDFAPERTLIIFDEFANNLTSDRPETSQSKEDNIKNLLNFFPVIAEDDDGEMIELNAKEVLTIPHTLKAHEVVRRGFMSNLLFTNIAGIFAYPKQVIDILQNVEPVKEGRVGDKSEKLEIPEGVEIDESGEVVPDNEIVISKAGAIFGDKIYEPAAKEIEEIVADTPKAKVAQTIAKKVVEESIAPELPKVAEQFEHNITQAEQTRIQKKIEKDVADTVVRVTTQHEIDVANIKKDAEQKLEVAKQEEKPVEEINYIVEAMNLSIAEAATEYTATLKEEIKVVVEEKKQEVVHVQEKKQEQKKANTVMEDVRSRLRGFARTIPSFIMAYGDRTLKLENFDSIIPDDVFQEVTGITIDQFVQLRDGWQTTDEEGNDIEIAPLFDKQTFDSSIEEFLDKKEEFADYFNPEITEDIFDYIPPQKTNQIFTPKKIVKMMVDLLEEENPGIFNDPKLKFIDLYTKSGLYLAELVKRLNVGLEGQIPDEQERLRHILTEQVYGLAPTEIIQNIAKSYVYGFLDEAGLDNIKLLDLVPYAKEGTAKEKLEEVFGVKKFDVVIGNPPYQEETKDTSDLPIYHTFMDSAFEIADKTILITPARFLFNAGKTPKAWNEKILNDPNFRVEYYEQDSSKIFPNTDIKGGVAVTYRDVEKDFGAIETFTHFPELNSIMRKVVHSKKFMPITEIIYLQSKFDLEELYNARPDLKEVIGSDGREQRLTTPSFAQLDIFTDEKQHESDVQILGLIKNKRFYKWIERKYLQPQINFEKYKVLFPASNGTGALGEILSTPLIGEPLIGFTQSFMSAGSFESKTEAEACLKYIKSKFSRVMLGILKITQHNHKSTWIKVPLQDFTENSDIDWSKSVPEIDQQLYKKYGLDEKEIEFIEIKVKAME